MFTFIKTLILSPFYYIKIISGVFYKYLVFKSGSSLMFYLALLEKILGLEFFGINITFLLLSFILTFADFLLGIIASKHEMEQSGRKLTAGIKSSPIQFTIFKFISLLLLLWLSEEVYRRFNQYSFIDYGSFLNGAIKTGTTILQISRTIMFFLICGREYISIGENIERRFNKKLYMFSIFEKLFDLIELKFIRKIENSKLCDINEENKTI